MKATEEQAYREYVVARMDALRRTAFLLCHDWHTADDVVAIALDKLYRRWSKATQARNTEAYVRAIVLNVWLDERRRPWRRESPAEQVPERGAYEAPTRDEHGLLDLLRALPAKRRAVLVLRFYCDLSIEETAEILGMPIGTVKSQTARGLDALRAAITVESGVPR